MNIFDRIRDKAYEWGDRLDQSAGALPRETDEARRLRDMGEVVLSPAVVQELTIKMAFQGIVQTLDSK